MKNGFLFLVVTLFCTCANGQTIAEEPAPLEDSLMLSEQFNKIKHNRGECAEYYSRGRRFDKEGKYNLSIGEYTQSIKCDTLFVKGYFARGTARINDFQYREAVKDFDKVLELSPYNGNAYFYRAFARMINYRTSKGKTSDTHDRDNYEVEVYVNPPSGRMLTKIERETVCNDYKAGLTFSSEKTAIVEALRSFCDKNQE